MKLLLDMNLPPAWVGFLQEEGFEALHWSTVGDQRATDATIMEWARRAGHVVFTHDLDFSALLAATQAAGPSVIQVRTHDVLPDAIGGDVVRVLRTHATELEQGSIVQRRQDPVARPCSADPAGVRCKQGLGELPARADRLRRPLSRRVSQQRVDHERQLRGSLRAAHLERLRTTRRIAPARDLSLRAKQEKGRDSHP